MMAFQVLNHLSNGRIAKEISNGIVECARSLCLFTLMTVLSMQHILLLRGKSRNMFDRIGNVLAVINPRKGLTGSLVMSEAHGPPNWFSL